MRPRKTIAALGVLTLLLLTGCAQISVHSTVNADGTISEYQLNINTSRQVYGLLDQSAENDGYDSVRESLLSDINESRADNIAYDEEFNGDEVSMTLTATNFDPPASSTISITEEDGQLVYEDLTFVNESAEEPQSEMASTMMSTVSVDYYVTMPGEITDSNADDVDGNTAEWYKSGSDAFNDNRIYVESENPPSLPMPGFGGEVALLAIALLVGVGVWFSNRNSS